MLTDSLYTAGITKTLDLFAEANVPTHAYKYTHKGEHSYAAFIGGSEGIE